MLEDDLRKMFGARVQTPLAAMDPAGKAITRGRALLARRKLLVGGMCSITLVALIAGLAFMKGYWAPAGTGDGRVTFEALYGDGGGAGGAAERPLPVIDM